MAFFPSENILYKNKRDLLMKQKECKQEIAHCLEDPNG